MTEEEEEEEEEWSPSKIMDILLKGEKMNMTETETDQEVFERVCKTGIMTVLKMQYEGKTPEEILESARVKEFKTLLKDRRKKI